MNAGPGAPSQQALNSGHVADAPGASGTSNAYDGGKKKRKRRKKKKTEICPQSFPSAPSAPPQCNLKSKSPARIPHLPDEIIGLLCECFVAPVPRPQPDGHPSTTSFIRSRSDIATLRALCLVSKRFDDIARPRLYRHIMTTPGALVLRRGRLGRTLLLSIENHHWQDPDKSSLRLAKLVQTLHIEFLINDPSASDFIRILSACTHLRMVSIKVALLQPRNELLALHSALQELKHLSMLSWRGMVNGDDTRYPLFFDDYPSQLDRLESLRLHHACDERHLLTRPSSEVMFQLRDAFPRLRAFDLIYDSHRLSIRENTVQDLRTCLVKLLDRTPNVTGVAITASMTAEEMDRSLPSFLVDRLQRLVLWGRSFAKIPSNVDAGLLAPFSKLNSLSISDILQPDAWSSLPVKLEVLELRLGAVGDFDLFIQFLAIKENLPALRSLRVDITKMDPVRQALDDNAAVGLLVLDWIRLRAACNARGVHLRPGSWISRWRAIE